MKLFLTIDVETYTGDYACDVWAQGEGLDYVLEVCAKHCLPATFFVEALGATRWGPSGIEEICTHVGNAGQDVQLHLHPAVAAIDGLPDVGDVLRLHDKATQAELMRIGQGILRDAGAGDVIAFRAGDLAADETTLQAMEICGIRLGSNRDLDQKTTIQSRINDLFPVRNDICEWRGIVDLPVTAPRSPFSLLDGHHRHLQICAINGAELNDALGQMVDFGYETATVLTHPKEFFRRSGGGFAPNMKNRKRLEQFAKFVSQRDDIEAFTVSKCLDVCSTATSARRAVRFKPRHTMLRILEQGIARMTGF